MCETSQGKDFSALGVDIGISESNPAGLAIVRFAPNGATELVLRETFLAREQEEPQQSTLSAVQAKRPRRTKKPKMVKDAHERAYALGLRVEQLLQNHIIHVVAIEDAHMQRNVRTATQLAFAIGCIGMVARHYPYAIHIWHPAQWRKLAWGAGNHPLGLQRLEVCQEFEIAPDDITDHEVAAIGLCKAAWKTHKDETKQETEKPNTKRKTKVKRESF